MPSRKCTMLLVSLLSSEGTTATTKAVLDRLLLERRKVQFLTFHCSCGLLNMSWYIPRSHKREIVDFKAAF